MKLESIQETISPEYEVLQILPLKYVADPMQRKTEEGCKAPFAERLGFDVEINSKNKFFVQTIHGWRMTNAANMVGGEQGWFFSPLQTVGMPHYFGCTEC